MRKTSPNSPVNNKTDSKSLELSALSKFQAGSYKEAIELYKTLLKTTEKPEWRQTLAQCYLQRSLSFAAKGMVKEAVVLWESYIQNSAASPAYFDYYLAWLLQANDVAKAKKYLQQLTTPQLDEQYPVLASILGLLIITSKPEIQALLPQDSVFIKHLVIVQAALAAYWAGQYETVETQLQQLPFRSAFKDFRTLLKAVIAFPEAKENAQAQLAKIAAESPYHNMAKSLLACTRDGSALVKDLSQLTQKQAQLVGAAKKFNKKQLELLDVVLKQKARLSDKLKFNLTLQYQSLFGDEWSRRYCYSALATYSAGQRDFIKHFGQWDEFEECRLKALSYERKGNLHDALYYWKRGVAILQKQEPLENLKIALLMRHIASKEHPLSETIAWLEDSLDYDPDDRETYLKIVKYYENAPQQADNLKQWLDNSIEKFPQDIDFLLSAVNDATRRQAFEESVQYARAVLRIDPVNVPAKQALFNSHLAHIRTLIKSKQFQRLDKEMQDIQSLALSKRDQLMVAVMQGFCLFAQAKTDKSQGTTQIADSVQQLYPELLTAHFYAMMEASLMGLPLATVIKTLPTLTKDYAVSPHELTQFIELLLQYHNRSDTQSLLGKIINKVKAPLKQAFNKKQLDSNLLLSFCQCMDSISNFELMRACVKSNQAEHKTPIWTYYRIYSEVNGDADKCSYRNINILEHKLNEALSKNDQRTAVLIEKFLDKHYQNKVPKNIETLAGLLGININSDKPDPMALFDYLPSEVYEKIDKKSDDLLKKMGLDRLITVLIKQYFPDDDGTVMKRVLGNIEAMQALSFIKAAEELNIPLEVKPADIIKCIDDEAASAPSRLPNFNLGDLLGGLLR